MLIQLVSLPTRRKRVCDGTFPNPRTGQPAQSEPHAHRLPSDARIRPCLSPRLMAGVPLPTGNLSPTRLKDPGGDIVTMVAMPAASRIAAVTTAVVLSLGQAMTGRVARLCVRVEPRQRQLVKGAGTPPQIGRAHV